MAAALVAIEALLTDKIICWGDVQLGEANLVAADLALTHLDHLSSDTMSLPAI
tara:strand:- start:3009 stop:3167 length:159 start_codon:yes stop_codon:yes gene_type:complete